MGCLENLLLRKIFHIYFKIFKINFLNHHRIDFLWENESFYTGLLPRIPIYISGIIGAMIYLKKIVISKYREVTWEIPTSILILLTILLNNHPSSVAAMIFYITIGKFLIGACLSWIILRCCTGHCRGLNTFLSKPIFVHVGKLSYVMYLIHPIIILYAYGMADRTTHLVSSLYIVILTGGFFIISYILGIFWSLLFEMPYINLSQEFLRNKIKQN